MKRQFITFILTLFAIVSSMAQGSKQITSRQIKSVFSVSRDFKKGTESKRITIETYDKKGRLLESKEFDRDSVLTNSETFVYNKKGKLTEHKTFNSEKGNGMLRETIQYDRWGRDTLKTEYDIAGVIKQFTRYSYNTMDDKLSEAIYDATNKLIKRTEFVYDKRGMLLGRSTYNASGDLIAEKKIVYTY